MSRSWKNYRQQRSNDVDDDGAELINWGIREDFIYEAKERAELGKPRLLQLDGWNHPFVRIVPPMRDSDQRDRPGASDRRNSSTVNRIVDRLNDVKSLDGPATIHAVDEMAAKLFAEAQNFATVIEAIRNSAQANIRRGAKWLQIKPIVHSVAARRWKDHLRAQAGGRGRPAPYLFGLLGNEHHQPNRQPGLELGQ